MNSVCVRTHVCMCVCCVSVLLIPTKDNKCWEEEN